MKNFTVFCGLLVFVVNACAQDSLLKNRMMRMQISLNADSAQFAPASAKGWRIYQSYVKAIKRDSVGVQVVISRSRKADWGEFQTFGKIVDKKLWPSTTQEIKYKLLRDNYLVKVDVDGSCSLKLVDGAVPSRDPVVLPIKFTFKSK